MIKSKTSIEISKSDKTFLQNAAYYVKPAILPILLSIIPTLYHYSNNVKNLTLLNLSRMLIFNVIVAILVYLVCLMFTKSKPVRAAIMAFVFLIFFNIYGLLYRFLIDFDVVRIEHYVLLPLVILLALYSMFFMSNLKDPASVNLWKSLALISSVLIVFNLINIVPAEAGRLRKKDVKATSLETVALPSPVKASPDIYYILLDEFAGFDAMREYWKYDGVDDLVKFLEERGFFVAEASHGSSTDTLREMATRLNYQEYPPGPQKQTFFDDRADSRVMRYLKSRGYTTVAFDELKMAHPAATTIEADYLYEFGTSAIPLAETPGYGLYFDEFGELVVDNTMLYAISDWYKKNSPLISQHNSMISYTVEQVANKEIPSPKFVYVHLLLPHEPFIFNQNGEVIDNENFANWYHYLDHYIYTIKILEKIVGNILSEYDPENPPIIILQSDHGARNAPGNRKENVILENYPEEYKTLILNALLLPGYDYSKLPQDIKPINTFPIIFNYLFDDNIPLQK
jgi:hypothetical protein